MEIISPHRKMLKEYQRYFRFCKAIGRSRLPNFFLVKLMGRAAPVIHPQRNQKKNWRIAWQQQGITDQLLEQSWHQYLRNGAIATAMLYRIGDLPRTLPLEIFDEENCLAAHRERGGVILPYHQHYAYHISVLLAAQGIVISPITLSPSESPISELYESYAKSWFSDSEALLNGGKWIFTSASDGGSARQIIRRLKAGDVLYSAIDIDNFYKNSPKFCVKLFETKICIPSRLIELAAMDHRPVSCAFLLVNKRGHGQIHLRALTGGGDLAAIANQYMSTLERLLRNNPEFWENWSLLSAPND